MRGAGKSTWARHTFPLAKRFDQLDERLFQDYLRNSRLFGRELRLIPAGQTVVVDEIQRLPPSLNEVHRFIKDSGLRRRVIVFPGDRPYRTEDGIEALPVAEFLEGLAEGML